MNIRPANLDTAVPSIRPDVFRNAMRELSGGVSVMTVGIGNERSGMTATSVSALSLNPPTLIVCVNKDSSTWPLLLRYRSFGVNVLHAGHEGIADRFCGRSGAKGEQRYGEDQWITLETGASLLARQTAAVARAGGFAPGLLALRVVTLVRPSTLTGTSPWMVERRTTRFWLP